MGIAFMQPAGTMSLGNVGIDLKKGVGELIDNSIGAGSKKVIISFEQKGNGEISYLHADDGFGINGQSLPFVLSFGGEIDEKTDADIGKFHAGCTITSISFSNYTMLFSKKAGGDWFYTYLNVEELRETMEVPEAQRCQLPDEIIENFEITEINRNCLNAEEWQGSIFYYSSLHEKIITSSTFKSQIESLKYYIGETYSAFLRKGIEISLFVNRERVTCLQLIQ